MVQALTRLMLLASTTFLVSLAATAGAPEGYYETIDVSTPQSMRQSLHDIIDDHTRFPYSSDSTDTWDILEAADADPADSSRVLDIYKNASYPKQGGGNSFYNREHSWPKSYGFPDDGETNYPYTDAHHLFISDSNYNSSRGNKPFDECNSSCESRDTEFNNNDGGEANDANYTSGSGSTGTWEVWTGRRGDIARAMFYMAVRYEGGVHGITNVAEPDLILTNDRSLIANSATRNNEAVAYMGLLSVLLSWHIEDPVSIEEQMRNDVVFSHQGNRNPFVDHPEYVTCVFQNDCTGIGGGVGDIEAPAAPTQFTATVGETSVQFSWAANTEADLAGYRVFRSEDGISYNRLTSLVATTSFTDSNIKPATTYYYRLAAVDTSNNESISVMTTVTTKESPTSNALVWINEIHYDNEGADLNEGVEIAGPAGTDLSGWQVVLYNGNGGSSYDTKTLSGIIVDQDNGFGTFWVELPGMQSGPDGIALIDKAGQVIQFLSYEGAFSASNGPANGMTAIDIGVAQNSSTPVGSTLQLGGTGTQYKEFTWQSALAETNGFVNIGQSFGGERDTFAPGAPRELNGVAKSSSLELTWAANAETDLAGYFIYQSTDNETFTKLNSRLVSTTSYAVEGLNAETTYYFYVTAIDLSRNESSASAALKITTDSAPETVEGEIWINEIHYDNASSDIDELVEVAGPANVVLSGWKVVLYNGKDGKTYRTLDLEGIIPDQSNGFGTVAFLIPGIQNGAPDGIALVSSEGDVTQFLSYEGSFTANNGPASGMVSTDIGVSETSSTPAGESLQLAGEGTKYSDFTWQAPQVSTANAINVNQSFPLPVDTTAPVAPVELVATGGEQQVMLTWSANAEADLAGYRIYQSKDGNTFNLINQELLTATNYVDGELEFETTYFYFITAMDLAGNESAASATVSAATMAAPDTQAPIAPLDINAQVDGNMVRVTWAGNAETDLAGYNVYRIVEGQTEAELITVELLTVTEFGEVLAEEDTIYTYFVTAVDMAGNESEASASVTAKFEQNKSLPELVIGFFKWLWHLIFG